MQRIPIRTIRNEDDIFNQTPLPEWSSLEWIESASLELGCLWETAKSIFDQFYNNNQFTAWNFDSTPDNSGYPGNSRVHIPIGRKSTD